jgi:hypothetical protein
MVNVRKITITIICPVINRCVKLAARESYLFASNKLRLIFRRVLFVSSTHCMHSAITEEISVLQFLCKVEGFSWPQTALRSLPGQTLLSAFLDLFSSCW